MRELDLGLDRLPALSFALLSRCVEKGIVTKEGAVSLWSGEDERP